MAGGVRGVIALRQAGGVRRVQTSINRSRTDLNLQVEVAMESEHSEVPIWSRVTSERAEQAAWKAAFVELVLREQPAATSRNALGNMYAAQFDRTAKTLSTHARGTLKYEAGAWVPLDS